MFQNLNFFHFSWHIIRLVCRAVTIFFLLTQRPRLGGPFRYVEYVRQANRKFSRGLWKKFQPNKCGFIIPTWFWASFHPHSLVWKIFQRPLENFLLAWRTCSRYLKGLHNLALCVSKKFVTVRRINEANSIEKQNEVIFYEQNLSFFVLFLKNGHLRYPGSIFLIL